jgi:hypothetical protein
MTTNKISTIEMTRKIRDDIYEQIKDKTLLERLAFYQDKAQAIHRQLGIQEPNRPTNVPSADHTYPISDGERLRPEP